MKKGEYKLVWESADVAPNGTLSVPTMGDGSGMWHDEFGKLAADQFELQPTRPWRKIGLAGSVVQVYNVEIGHEAELKAHLDEMAAQASDLAVPKEAERDAKWAEREALHKQRVKDSAEMQDRFRAA